VAFDHRRGQHAGAIGAGIDAKAVGSLIDAVADGMAMNDEAAMVVRVGQERLADPAQVVRLLVLNRDAGTDTGVNKQVIAEPDGVAGLLQECDMRRRDRLAQHRGDPHLVHCLQGGGGQAVAFDTGVAAKPQPVIGEARLAIEDAQQDLLVIAEQQQRLGRKAGQRANPFDDAGGVRPAVDQIT
jgi:hypothetical protein